MEPDDVFEIDDLETLQLLADETRVSILELALVPRTVTELADELAVPRTRLYHHVHTLEERGLIRVVETRRAGAVEEKVYQAAAKAYKPSRRFLETASPREQAEAVAAAVLGTTSVDFIRSMDRGIATFDQRGESRSVSVARRLLRLTPTELSELVSELEELVGRYDRLDEEDPGDDPDRQVIGVLTVVYPSSRRLPG